MVEVHGSVDVSLQRNTTRAEDDALSSALEGLDFSALSASDLKLRAQPWTALAGDGLVSELLSSFFAHENCYYLPFVDQERFVDDMEAGDVNHSEFCSPLLVNAICALRSVSLSSERQRLSLISLLVHLRPCQSVRLVAGLRRPGTLSFRSKPPSGARVRQKVAFDSPGLTYHLRMLFGSRQR